MTKDEVIKLFPLTTKVSFKDLILSRRLNIEKCYGARTLRRLLRKHGYEPINISWGTNSGSMDGIGLTSNVNFMETTICNLNRKVTFNLRSW